MTSAPCLPVIGFIAYPIPSSGDYHITGEYFTGDTGETDANLLLNSNAANPLFSTGSTTGGGTFFRSLHLNQNDTRGWGTGSPTLMGGQSGQKLLVLDGAASQDSGNRDFGYIAPSVDAIAEVRVLMANFNAEYGARSGG